MNKGANKIRLCHKTKKEFKAGDEKAIELMTRVNNKFHNWIMVFDGIYNEYSIRTIFNTGKFN